MIETIQKENLKSLLNNFETVLDTTIQQTWAENESEEHLSKLVNGLQTVADQALHVGKYSFHVLLNPKSDPVENFPSLVIHYSWMENVKSFLILWRDVVFQYQKALVLHHQGKVTLQGMEKLRSDSKTVVKRGGNDLISRLEEKIESLVKQGDGLNLQLSKWKKQQVPWETYENQIKELNKHGQHILEKTEKLLAVSESFQKIENLLYQNITTCNTEIQQLTIMANESIKKVEAEVEEKPGKVAAQLEDMESKIETTDHLQTLNDHIDETVKGLPPSLEVPVGTDGGVLLFREINFQRNTRQWLDSEILPVVYELWEINDQVINRFKMALVNIRNKALLFSNELKEGKETSVDQTEFCFPLVAYLEKTEEWKSDLQKQIDLINERVKKDFQLKEIYSQEEYFLPVPLQSTINQFRLNQNPWVVKSQDWLKNQVQRFQRFKAFAEQEESMSMSEKIVRFVQTRKAPKGNESYASIFLTKGYIGKSFWVGRKNELTRFENLVDQWKLGFRGAVIISGQRFSGKSLFGDYVANHHFYHKNIRLVPNASIRVEGRILNTTYDLSAALEFIQKYSLNTRSMIWIDDLEHWSDPNIPLSKNVRALCSAIDNYGSRLFFLVSMSNWLLTHLNKTHELLKIFQAEINLDKMSPAEIKEAILIRHGATHKRLVNSEDEEPSPKDFQKMTKIIYRNTQGNIGESLTNWSNSIHSLLDEKVEFKPLEVYSLPDFLNPDTALILSTLMMEKRTNEYRLRKLFGSPFKEKYQSIIQRLISVGILVRHLDGWLEINELAVNEVGRILNEKKYIQFY